MIPLGAQHRERQVGRLVHPNAAVRECAHVTPEERRRWRVVQVDRRVRHPRYHKFLSRRSKFMAHDERNECAVGDVVEIVASRPLSKSKRWRVRSIVEKAVRPGGEAEA